MPHIAIISGSVRTGRNSHRVSLYFESFIAKKQLGSSEILDLAQYQFPVFDERLKFQKNPLPQTLEFAEKIKKADGIILVVPEYNGGYPAAVKNAVDLLYDEWFRKPIGIVTVSAGDFAGIQMITSLQFTLWKMKAWTIPATFAVPKVQDSFTEDGNATNADATDKRAAAFLDELLWCVEAKQRMAK